MNIIIEKLAYMCKEALSPQRIDQAVFNRMLKIQYPLGRTMSDAASKGATGRLAVRTLSQLDNIDRGMISRMGKGIRAGGSSMQYPDLKKLYQEGPLSKSIEKARQVAINAPETGQYVANVAGSAGRAIGNNNLGLLNKIVSRIPVEGMKGRSIEEMGQALQDPGARSAIAKLLETAGKLSPQEMSGMIRLGR